MKKAVIYGAGNIGRGFIGQLFSESGYELVFVDVNQAVVEQLNRERRYPIRILSQSQNHHEIWIQNVRAVNGKDAAAVAAAIATADLMATAVGVNVLPHIIEPLCLGFQKRWRDGNFDPLNIIICENLLEADQYMARLMREHLDDREKDLFPQQIGLVEASIGRMVPVMTPEMQEGNILRVCVEEYCELPVDRDGFKGAIPAVKNMAPESPFLFFIQRKLFIHNMGHAICAYCGNLRHYHFIWEAVSDPAVKNLAAAAMRQAAAALSKEHGAPLATILPYIDNLLDRFGNKALGDTIERVGRDPLRKLAANDRFVGAIQLCGRHGLDVSFLCAGMAAALYFDAAGDPAAREMQEYIQVNGAARFLTEKCGLEQDGAALRKVLQLYPLVQDGQLDWPAQ